MTRFKVGDKVKVYMENFIDAEGTVVVVAIEGDDVHYGVHIPSINFGHSLHHNGKPTLPKGETNHGYWCNSYSLTLIEATYRNVESVW